jgi:hypothetical protein
MSFDEFVAASLAAIESRSIRAWAQTEHNAPIVREMAERAFKLKHEPARFAAYLVCVAMEPA